MQAQADLLQVPVEVYPSPDATALGVGAFARLGLRRGPSPAEAVGEWKPVVFEPRMAADEAATARALGTRCKCACRARHRLTSVRLWA